MSLTPRLTRGLSLAVVVIPLIAWLSGRSEAQPAHRCAAAATEQAGRLLAFHVGSADRVEVGPSVKTLAPIRNPANRQQRFDVLELWGYIEKGQYRMRFLYARLPGECVLMGQEILEHAAL